jgi:hypothetical protein
MTIQREQLDFGYGSFVGPVLNDPEFYDLPIRDQARIIGWAVGCPLVNELTDPQNTSSDRGPESMVYRYGEVGFWFGYIARSAQDAKPDLYSKLMSPVIRNDDEPIGKFEIESVPDNYLYEIPPMETLPGYALPRILIKQFGNDLPRDQAQARLARGLSVLSKAVANAQTPEQLLALVADGLSQADISPIETLKTTLPVGWFEEHNANRMLSNVKDALQANAPTLWQVYEGLNNEEKAIFQIL